MQVDQSILSGRLLASQLLQDRRVGAMRSNHGKPTHAAFHVSSASHFDRVYPFNILILYGLPWTGSRMRDSEHRPWEAESEAKVT